MWFHNDIGMWRFLGFKMFLMTKFSWDKNGMGLINHSYFWKLGKISWHFD